ncbi:MAG: hypothetical protein AAGH76_07050 [Pseudomonadota bacterium]
MRKTITLSLLLALSTVSCQRDDRAAIATLPNPAGDDSRFPNLSAAVDGSLWMSWYERAGASTTALRVARFDGQDWSEPQTVVASDALFVNWADFAAVSEYAPGSLVAHWLERSGDAPYAYDVRLAFSTDGGASFSESQLAHSDGTSSEHGFVSHIPIDGGVGLIWLDGRDTASLGTMQLRYAEFSGDGSISHAAVLDERVCECCQTAAIRLSDRTLVAYRDRSPAEIRDIAMTVRRGERWSSLGVPVADNWQVSGCPVNGPAVAANGKTLALAWYTQADGQGRVRIARSTDRGHSFRETELELTTETLGRADIVVLDNADIVVSWLQRDDVDSGAAVWRVQRFDLHGRPGPALDIAVVSAERSSGFARMQKTGNRLLFAWTDTHADQPRVYSALVSLAALARR